MTGPAASIVVASRGRPVRLRWLLNALAEQYGNASGHKLDLTYRTVGQHLQLIKSGEDPAKIVNFIRMRARTQATEDLRSLIAGQPDVADVTGRPPRTFRQWAQAHAGAF